MPLPKAPSKPATILLPADSPAAQAPRARRPASALRASAGGPATELRAPVGKPATELRAPVGKPATELRAPVGKPASEPRVRERPAAHLALVETRARAAARKPRAANARPKLFVLDTNVLMHDPTSLFRFEEHDIFLPMMTLEELDGHKKGMSEVARNARQASRSLDALVAACRDPIERGIALSSIGNTEATGRLFLQTEAITDALPPSLPVGKADNHILGVVRALSQTRTGCDVVLVSKDINMRVKARALGLSAEDYTNDKVLEDTDVLYTGVLALPDNFWDRHSDRKSVV